MEWMVLAAAVAGALIGAAGAYIVGLMARNDSRTQREEARRERFDADVRTLAGELLRAAAEHAREVREELAWRASPDNAHWPLSEKPSIGSTEPMYGTQAEMHVIVQRPETAAAAFRLYRSTVTLDGLAFDPRRDIRHEGSVQPIDADAFLEALTGPFSEYNAAADAFIAAVRVELDRELRCDGDSVAASSAIFRRGRWPGSNRTDVTSERTNSTDRTAGYLAPPASESERLSKAPARRASIARLSAFGSGGGRPSGRQSSAAQSRRYPDAPIRPSTTVGRTQPATQRTQPLPAR